MTREEAINTVRNIYQTDKEKEALEILIPQLAESEDERIRKWLVGYFETISKNWLHDHEMPLNSILAWLERQELEQKKIDEYYRNLFANAISRDASLYPVKEEQKEQKVDIDKLRKDIYQSGYNDGYQHGKEDTQKEQKQIKCELEDAFKNYTDAGITVYCGDLVASPKEQKSADLPPGFYFIDLDGKFEHGVGEYFFDEEKAYYISPAMEINKDNLTQKPEKCEKHPESKTFEDEWKDYYNNSLINRQPMPNKREIARHFFWFGKQQAEKPAEWSDTDNIGWDEAFACVTQAEKSAKNEEELQNAVTAEKWLKEIKFKYYVHPVKQEWSEDNEEMICNIISSLRGYMSTISQSKTYTNHESYIQKEIEWLNSLKPSEQKYTLADLEKEWKHGYDFAIGEMGKSMPMPEDTVLFNKGVAEGRRLEREDMWKPSEEQMLLLNAAIKNIARGGIFLLNDLPILESLYNDLKKLKED